MKIKINECNNNVILYESEKRIYSKQMFNEFFKCCFCNKKEKLTTRKDGAIFKIISTKVHGLMAQKKKRCYTNNKKGIEIPLKSRITSIDSQCKKVITVSQFMYPYARMCIFICAKVRYVLLKSILDNVDDLNKIVMVNTDSFSCIDLQKEQTNFIFDKNIGNWKIEEKYSGNIIIKNLHNVVKNENDDEYDESESDSEMEYID